MRLATLSALLLTLAGCAVETDKGALGADADVALGDLGSADHGRTLYQGELVFGELVEGAVTARSPYHYWSFEVDAGAELFFDAASRDGDDLFLLIYRRTATGYELYEHNDDCYAGTLNACLELTFPEAGEYAALVTTWSYAARGVPAAASYHLQATCRSCAAECDVPEGSHYVGGSPDECARIRFACIATMTYFSNECGCGCAPIEPPPAAACEVAGCSGQLCVEPGEGGITTCEWREEYACYRSATCERQAGGACGWTQTPELLTCLADARSGGSL